MVELPSDIWSVIINHLTMNEVQYIAFISQVSKQISLICNKHKQQRNQINSSEWNTISSMVRK
jgi:hypothetical protein